MCAVHKARIQTSAKVVIVQTALVQQPASVARGSLGNAGPDEEGVDSFSLKHKAEDRQDAVGANSDGGRDCHSQDCKENRNCEPGCVQDDVATREVVGTSNCHVGNELGTIVVGDHTVPREFFNDFSLDFREDVPEDGEELVDRDCNDANEDLESPQDKGKLPDDSLENSVHS